MQGDIAKVMSRRRGLIAVQTLLGVGLLIGWLWIIDIESVGHSLSQTKWPFVALAAAIGLLSGILRTFRWRMILTPIARIAFVDIWLISTASSLINFVIPIRSGEIARSLFLKQRDKVPISASLPTVAVDRSFDLLAVVLIGAAGALAGLRLASSLSLVLLLGAGLLSFFAISVLLAIFWKDRFLSFAERTIPRLVGENIGVRILTVLEGIIVGFTTVGSQPGKLLPIVIMSFLAAFLDAAVFFLILLSVGAMISPVVAITGYALFVVTFIVPGAPGYVGSMEAFGSLIFTGLGVDQTVAASAVLIFHALSALILGIAGGLSIWALGFRPSMAFRTVVDAQSLAGIPSSEPQPGPES